jgi:hemin uptake protein HemP
MNVHVEGVGSEQPLLSPRQDCAQGGAKRTIRTAILFGSRTEVLIDHRGEIYRLRITRQDKLILTK